MSLLNGIISGVVAAPRVTTIYGGGGLGKSTFASRFPNPLFISYEAGTNDLEVNRTPLVTDSGLALGVLNELAHDSEHGFRTVVIDSADAAETLFRREVIRAGVKDSFGKRDVAVSEKFEELLRTLSAVKASGLEVVVIAHAGLQRIENPDGTSWDCYGPKLSKRNGPSLVEFSDEVLFVRRRVFQRKVEEDFGRERKIAKNAGGVEAITQAEPGHIAKSRLELPERFDFWNFEEYAEHNPRV